MEFVGGECVGVQTQYHSRSTTHGHRFVKISIRKFVFGQNAVRIVAQKNRQRRLHSPLGESGSRAQRGPFLPATAFAPAAVREREVVGDVQWQTFFKSIRTKNFSFIVSDDRP